jgi:putative membrane protein insertion efficiency factor
VKQLLIVLINLYKKLLSPLFFYLFGSGCRYTPTCSDYAIIALKRFGVVKGGKLAIIRILSCHPYSKKNHYDPVPER